MQELENLLTSLVQRGRKPKGREVVLIQLDQEFTKSEGKTVFYCSCKDWFWFYADLRRLVSLESWLWQFCMENGLLNSPDQYPHKDFRAKNPRPYWEMSLRRDCYYKTEVYQYRLIESALIPEDQLAKFLLSNIVIEWNSK